MTIYGSKNFLHVKILKESLEKVINLTIHVGHLILSIYCLYHCILIMSMYIDYVIVCILIMSLCIDYIIVY